MSDITAHVPTNDEEAEQALLLCCSDEGMKQVVLNLYRLYRIRDKDAFNLDVLEAYKKVLLRIVGEE